MWVRPREMFFENVTIEGQIKPRFEKINFKFEQIDVNTDEQLSIIENLSRQIFPSFDRVHFESVLRAHTQWHGWIVYDQPRDSTQLVPVGFKLGYARSAELFYSWHGGVLPAFRRLGLASDMMKRQHEWAQSKGYQRIETRCRNYFPEMIYLNLKSGFKIVGCQTDKQSQIKIIMEKNLN